MRRSMDYASTRAEIDTTKFAFVGTSWGGRMADMLASANAQSVFTAISASGSAVWLSGQDVRQYLVSGSGAPRLGGDATGAVYNSAKVGSTLAEILAEPTRSKPLCEMPCAASP